MPELPEVTTIRNDLRKEVVGKKIVGISIKKGFKLIPSPLDYKKYVVGHEITGIQNVAKLLVIELSSDRYIAVHLAMTGLLLLNNKDDFVKMTFKLEGGGMLNYSTVRMFGFLELWNAKRLNEYKSRYGPTALDKSLNYKEFMNKLTKKRTNIKTALLDQKVISGIGNIYANDALYLSKIHPSTKTADITESKYKDLLENIQLVLNEGITNRGSSIDRYRNIYGKKGSQQDHFRVYGKAGQPCSVCKTPIRFEKLQGRGTFFCEKCQK